MEHRAATSGNKNFQKSQIFMKIKKWKVRVLYARWIKCYENLYFDVTIKQQKSNIMQQL